jgi:hypothetical protein
VGSRMLCTEKLWWLIITKDFKNFVLGNS